MSDKQNSLNQHGIGRVGGLAAALGIGFAIALLSPTAAAETADTETSTADQTSTPAKTTPARTNRSAAVRAETKTNAAASPVRRVGRSAPEPAAPLALRSTAAAVPTVAVAPSAATVPVLTPQTPDVFAPNIRGVVYGGARIRNVGAGSLNFTTAATSVGGATVSINPNTGAFSYTPTQAQRQAAGLNTTDTFTITATSARGVTTNQLVTVVVDPGTPMPRTPWVPRPDAFTGVVRGTSKFSDESGRTLTYSTPTTTSGGGAVTIDAATGEFTYTPTRTQRQAAGLATTDTFTVTADNGVRTTTQVITVAVDPGTPFANTPWVRTPNRTTGVVTGIAKFVEPSGRTLTYSTPTTSTGGGAVTINAATGDFTYTPTATQRQSAGVGTTDTFTITANNGVRTTTQTVTVAVNPNAAPTLTPTVGTPAAATGAVNGSAGGADANGDTITYTVSQPTNGAVTINPQTGAFVYTPNAGARPATPPRVWDLTDGLSSSAFTAYNGTQTYPGEDVTKAFDGNTLTKWFEPGLGSEKVGVTVDFGTPVVVDGLPLTAANDRPDRDPASYEVWGSSDGTNFTMVASGGLTAPSERYGYTNATFANTTAYRYYRVIFPTNRGCGSNCFQVSEIAISGTRPAPLGTDTFTVTAVDGRGGVTTRQVTVPVG